jgi:hypothetical protein
VASRAPNSRIKSGVVGDRGRKDSLATKPGTRTEDVPTRHRREERTLIASDAIELVVQESTEYPLGTDCLLVVG